MYPGTVSSVDDLIILCQSLDIQLSASTDNQIIASAKPGAITKAIAKAITDNKPELLRRLIVTDDVVSWATSTQDTQDIAAKVICATCLHREPSATTESYAGCQTGHGYYWGRKPHPCIDHIPYPPA